jgi:inorganic pyrophosphatase
MPARLPKAALVDIDGTLTFAGEVIPGASEILGWLHDHDVAVRLLTNIDSRSPKTIGLQLSRLGLHVDPADIFTPAVAALRLLQQTDGSRCLGLVSPDLARMFEAFLVGSGQADYVLVGDCRGIDGYSDLNAAFRQLMGGAQLLALSEGRWFYTQEGEMALDTGAFVRLLEYGSGKQRRLLGKPSRDFFELALASAGCTAAEAIVVGDDVTTDIVGANAIGAFSILVRTGKFSANAALGDAHPDAVVDSIAQIARYPRWRVNLIAPRQRQPWAAATSPGCRKLASRPVSSWTGRGLPRFSTLRDSLGPRTRIGCDLLPATSATTVP